MAQTSQPRILLVEDEPTNMFVLSAYLRNAGYAVDEVDNGLKAWQQLNNDPHYTLVVTDRLMPHMDGLELFSCMKKDARFLDIPVIMQTAATAPEQVVEGIKAGVYYYLTKPYQEETLLMLVRSAIRDREQSLVFNEQRAKQREALTTLQAGEFWIRSPEEAQSLAFMLGSLLPQAELAVSGLYELLLNAIEHGNLGIGYELKNRLLSNAQWDGEINRRLNSPEFADKHVKVEFRRHDGKVNIAITDQGNGFDWRPFMEIEPSRATQANGRGIAKANLLSFDNLAYANGGRTVQIVSKSESLSSTITQPVRSYG